MKQLLCRVIENRALMLGLAAITCDSPELARTIRPGQFVLAREPATRDPYLRRTLFPLQIEEERVQFALRVDDPLARRVAPGDILDLLAPLGNVIDLSARHVLLVGEAHFAAPLLFLAHAAVQQARDVVLIVRAPDRDQQMPAHLLPSEVEYHAQSGEGEWLKADWITWADAIFASAKTETYEQLAREIAAARFRLTRGLAHALAHVPMPCGIGDCWACAMETAQRIEPACQAGPFFDLADLRR